MRVVLRRVGRRIVAHRTKTCEASHTASLSVHLAIRTALRRGRVVADGLQLV
jgi:hypothetical protein